MTYLTQKIYTLSTTTTTTKRIHKAYDLGWEVQAKQVNNMQNTNPETKHTGIDCGSIFDDARLTYSTIINRADKKNVKEGRWVPCNLLLPISQL